MNKTHKRRELNVAPYLPISKCHQTDWNSFSFWKQA